MDRVKCSFCGLPFSVRHARDGADYYCCSGCALASKIAVNDGGLPVSAGLIAALAVGFGLFNEILFTVLGNAVVSEGRAETGGKLLWIALGLGLLLSILSVVLIFLARRRSWSDAVAVVPLLGLAGWAAMLALDGRLGPASGWLLAGNIWLAAWLGRGWVRRLFLRRSTGASANSR